MTVCGCGWLAVLSLVCSLVASVLSLGRGVIGLYRVLCRRVV